MLWLPCATFTVEKIRRTMAPVMLPAGLLDLLACGVSVHISLWPRFFWLSYHVGERERETAQGKK